jgi:hypothetical protein
MTGLYRSAAVIAFVLVLVAATLLLILPEIGYFGFPFSVQIGERASASFVAVRPSSVPPSAIEVNLERFAAANGFSFRIVRIPGDTGHLINVVMENPYAGQLVVDNHLNAHRYVCYYYLQGHKEAVYLHVLASFKQMLSRSGAAVQAE